LALLELSEIKHFLFLNARSIPQSAEPGVGIFNFQTPKLKYFASLMLVS
jgi:hypothetical protein